jgi:hypothetical protein
MTKLIEGGRDGYQYGSLWQTIVTLNFLDQQFREQEAEVKKENQDSFFYNCIKYGREKLDWYWGKLILEDSPSYYAVATMLHPSFRLFWIQYKWKNFPKWIREAESSMRTVFKEYMLMQEEQEGEIPPPSRRKVPNGTTSYNAFQASLAIDPSYLVGEGKKRLKARARNELDRYYDDHKHFQDEVNDPLEWWHTKGKKEYPILYKMAVDFLSIPATSCECERVFSQAKKLITDERCRLSASTIEACETQKNWILNGAIHSPLIELTRLTEAIEPVPAEGKQQEVISWQSDCSRAVSTPNIDQSVSQQAIRPAVSQ